MADIFISYSAEDRPRVKTLVGVLEQHGWTVWWDRKIPPGKTFDQVIAQALDESKCVVVLWSTHSVNSDWVKEEASEAQRRGVLVPALLDDVTIPLGFRRLHAACLTDWKPTLPHPEFDQFQEAIAAIIGRDRVTQTQHPEQPAPPPDEPQRLETRDQIYREARSALDAEDWGGAVEKLQAVLAVDPTHREAAVKLLEAKRQQELAALYNSGSKHYRAGNWQTALKRFDQVLERDPNYKDTRSLREHVQQESFKERAAPGRRPQPAESGLEPKATPKSPSPPSRGADPGGAEKTARWVRILTTGQLVCSLLLLGSGMEIFARTRDGILIAPGAISSLFIGFPASVVLGKLSWSMKFRPGIRQGWLIPPGVLAAWLMTRSMPAVREGVLPYAVLCLGALILTATGARTLKALGTSRLLTGIALALPGGYLAALGLTWAMQGAEYLNSATLWEFYLWVLWPAASLAIAILLAGITALYPGAVRWVIEAVSWSGLSGTLGLVLGVGIVWHLAQQPLRTLRGHTNIVRSVSFSPDGALLASAADDETVRLWRVADAKLLHVLEWRSEMSGVCFSPDGTLLASGSRDATVQLWRVADGQLVRKLKADRGEDTYAPVESIAFSPDGSLLASGSGDETARLWRVSDGKLLRTLQGHANLAKAVAFSPDGAVLAVGTGDGTVRLWRVADGILSRTLEGPLAGMAGSWVWSIAFSPDGTLLAWGND